MNATPFQFRERVAALWKCCDDGIHSRCVYWNVPDCEWTRKAEKKRILFYIGCENGIWKYGFADRAALEKFLTVEQMLAHPNLKNVTIKTMFVYDKTSSLILLDVDMKRLMKVVTSLANEPYLYLQTASSDCFNNPEGATFLRCLSNIKFSTVVIPQCFPVYNQLLGNQFSRRIPTRFILTSIDQNRKFFEKNLKNGKIKIYTNRDNNGDYCFPAEVMEGIVNSFLKNPEEYKPGYFHISAQFDASTEAWLERKLKERSCYRDADGGYFFTGYNSKLQTQQRLIVDNCGESLYECTLRAL